MRTRGGIFIRNPRLMFNDAPEGGENGGGGGTGGTGGTGSETGTPKNFTDPSGKEWSFPEGVAVADMTDAQAREYWKHKAQKHEAERKPKDWEQIQADANAHRAAQAAALPADQQAIAAAAQTARLEGRRDLLVSAVRGELRAQRPHLTVEAADELIEDLNLDRFMTADGQLDIERVTALAAKIPAPAPAPKTPTDGRTLAQMVGTPGTPSAPGAGAGSVNSLRKEKLAELTGKKSN